MWRNATSLVRLPNKGQSVERDDSQAIGADPRRGNGTATDGTAAGAPHTGMTRTTYPALRIHASSQQPWQTVNS